MGLFKKNKKMDEYFEGPFIKNGGQGEENTFTMPIENPSAVFDDDGRLATSWEDRAKNVKAPHALTLEEIIGKPAEEPEKAQEPKTEGFKFSENFDEAADLLYKRMKANDISATQPKAEVEDTPTEIEPEPKTVEQEEFQEITLPEPKTEEEDTLTKTAQTLLERCSGFLSDENGNKYESNETTYTLDSVEDILNAAEKLTRDRMAAMYREKNITPQKTEEITTEAEEKKAVEDSASHNEIQFSFADEGLEEIFAAPERIEPVADQKTRVIDIASSIDKMPKRDFSAKTESFDLNLSDIPNLIDATVQPGEESVPEWEREFNEKQKKNPKAFRLFRGEEEENRPEEIAPINIKEKAAIEDYTCPDDAKTIRTDLSAKKAGLSARIIATLIITVFLILADTVLADFFSAISPDFLSLANVFMLVVAGLINLNTLKGITHVFSRETDMDTPAALSFTGIFIYSVATPFLNAEMPYLAAVATVCFLFNLIGKYIFVSRIRRGFEVIANGDEKRAVQFVENEVAAAAMAHGAVLGEPLICAGRRTSNITDYLANSYCKDSYEKNLKPMVIFSIVFSIIALIISIIFTSSVPIAFLTVALVLSISCPPSSLLLCNLPMNMISTKLKDYDAMIAGFESAEAISHANAVAIDAHELFPTGTVTLKNMNLMTTGAIDQYIIDAAAVAISAKSPLAEMFNQIIEGSRELLAPVDSIKYENRMGISGWIDQRRILIGNRALLEGHGIKVPPIEVDRKILRSGCFPVYLAVDSIPCALFTVCYGADEEITYELRRLCNTGVTLLINSCDPNLTEEMICDYFGLYKDSVKVMSSSGVSAYKQSMNYQESTSAPASFGDSVQGLAAIVTASIRLKSIVSISTALHIIGIILGVMTAVYMLLTGNLQFITPIVIIGYQLLCTAITSLVPYFKQP